MIIFLKKKPHLKFHPNVIIMSVLFVDITMLKCCDNFRFVFVFCFFHKRASAHPRRPRGRKGGTKVFKYDRKSPLGTDSHRTISKNSSGCRLLIGHKKCFVLLCPIGEQFLLRSFREFVHDGYCPAALARFVHQACVCKGIFIFCFPNQKRRTYR